MTRAIVSNFISASRWSRNLAFPEPWDADFLLVIKVVVGDIFYIGKSARLRVYFGKVKLVDSTLVDRVIFDLICFCYFSCLGPPEVMDILGLIIYFVVNYTKLKVLFFSHDWFKIS